MKSLLTRKVSPRAVIAVAALTLIGSLVSGRERSDLAVPIVERNAPVAQSGVDLDPGKLNRPSPLTSATDLFAPPPSAAPAYQQQPSKQPSKPTAPPLPFRYLGRAIEEGRTAVFLAHGNQNYSVARGGQAGNDYRIDQITDKAITFTYLPLGEHQTLMVPLHTHGTSS